MNDTVGHGSKLAHSRWAALAPALESRNFRLFWFAQLISTIGTSLHVAAEGYLIYDITDSTFWLGAVGFIALLPVLPISLVGGVLIDRLPRRKLIIITQSLLAVQALVFGLLAIFGRLELWNLLLLYFIFGAILAIDNPARRAFLVNLVSEDQLANAVALNATLFNFASVVGFALAGLLIATVGAGSTMIINAITYAFPILALLAIRVPNISQDAERGKIGVAMAEGFTTLFKQPAVLIVITIMAVVGGLAYPALFGLMPAYAKDVMQTDSVGLGILLAATALGSVLGTVVTARVGIRHRGRNLIVAALFLPLLVIVFAWAPSFWSACLALVGGGILLLVVQSLAITLVQVNIADRVRGRVMSIYSILHAGADTGSNLVVGTLAGPLGLPFALSVGGGVALTYAVVVMLFFGAIRKLD